MKRMLVLKWIYSVVVVTTICLLFAAVDANALSGAESIVHKGAKNELAHALQITCESSSSFCTDLCGYANQCVIPETACTDCVSNTYRLLNTIFTQLNTTFQISAEPRAQIEAVEFLRHQRFMSLSYDSYLNVFNPEKKETVRQSFDKLCNPSALPVLIRNLDTYNPEKSPVILIELDQDGRPVKPQFVLCQNGHSDKVEIRSVEFNPNFTPQNMPTVRP